MELATKKLAKKVGNKDVGMNGKTGKKWSSLVISMS